MRRPESQRSTEVKDWWSKAWVALIEDRREFAKLAEEILREQGGLTDTVIHQFLTCEQFLTAENLEDYDICFIDGDFGYGKMKGFEAVPLIRERKPKMLIVGLTNQKLYLQSFEDAQANLSLKKDELTHSVQQILALAPSQKEV